MFGLIFSLVYLVVFPVFFLIVIGVNKYSILKAINEIGLEVEDILNSSNFKISKILYLNDKATYNKDDAYKKFIAVDNKNKKLCLIDYQKGSLLILEFKDILNYEIYEDGSNRTIGGSWRGIFAAETNGMCKELKLIVRLNRYDISQISYEIISNTPLNIGVNKSSQAYKQCLSTMQQAVSFLEVVKHENENSK